jgi:TPR repeat
MAVINHDRSGQPETLMRSAISWSMSSWPAALLLCLAVAAALPVAVSAQADAQPPAVPAPSDAMPPAAPAPSETEPPAPLAQSETEPVTCSADNVTEENIRACDLVISSNAASEVRLHALVMRAKIYRDKGQFDLAIADGTEAIRLDPSSAEAFDGRGNTLAADKK